MVLGMLFENFKNYYILRYVIYEFLKKVLGVPQPTCLVRVHCAVLCSTVLQYSLLLLETAQEPAKQVERVNLRLTAVED